MPALSEELRRLLEKKVLEGRAAAEEAACAVVVTLAVEASQPYATLDAGQRRLRNALRARGRQLGEGSLQDGMDRLIEEIAYEQWHRMLFARFLAENGLLMHPSGAPITLKECGELASSEGEPDGWVLAARYASAMLPGIFRRDDPAAQVRFAPEGRKALESAIAELPAAIFTADDSLGWSYQFWQTKAKQEVSERGRRIAGEDLYAYTQLFTEDYMVRFLLENSLGAWWASRHPGSPLLKTFEYLRWRDDGTPAAGAFLGWPVHVAEVTIMDPCCGSGHFLVTAFNMLLSMRMEEGGLSPVEAADAVLRDNLFGLEIDPRCIQLAAFSLAFSAWKVAGYRPLPSLNLACSGIPVEGQLAEWASMAGRDVNLRLTLERLHHLFRNAPDIGSLISPAATPLGLITPDYSTLGAALKRALRKEHSQEDPVADVFGATAEGIAKATSLLSRTYTLVATNVPYIGNRKQGNHLRTFLDEHYPDGKADLATAFLERCREFTHKSGTYALVTPQGWLFQRAYVRLRSRLLKNQEWLLVARLGERSFRSSAAAGAFTSLCIISNDEPTPLHVFLGVDVSAGRDVQDKAASLPSAPMKPLRQASQAENPEARVTLSDPEKHHLLDAYAIAPQGIKTGDDDRFVRRFWEFSQVTGGWEYYQSTVEETTPYGGRSLVIDWGAGGKNMVRPRLGNRALGSPGVAVSQMRRLPATLYTGEKYDSNVAAIVPRDSRHLAALWAFCRSDEYHNAIRQIDQKIGVTNQTLLMVPFDVDYWQPVAEGAGPLPAPHSNDPTQWLHEGDPTASTKPLHVAVARLLGYRWPSQQSDHLDEFSEWDGIVCLPAVLGEQPAAERLRSLLVGAYGPDWSGDLQANLLAAAESTGKNLHDWLLGVFFDQHCRLFHNRPYIWHIWDGRKDGFSALVNYHKLDGANMDRLIYSYLGSWIERQRMDRAADVPGAEGRLVAALDLQQKLRLIREGEAPYDIYVRWKPLEEQPIGWNPDLNDGVRLNIRPFVIAGVLRNRFTIHWKKDKGKNPDGRERLNDVHLTLAEKRAARANQTGRAAGQ